MRQRINRSASKIRSGDVITLPRQGIAITVGPRQSVKIEGHGSDIFVPVSIANDDQLTILYLDLHEATRTIYGWIRKEEDMLGEVGTDGWPGAVKIWELEAKDVNVGHRYRLRSGHKVRVRSDPESSYLIMHHENYEPFNPTRLYSHADMLRCLNQCQAKPLVRCDAV